MRSLIFTFLILLSFYQFCFAFERVKLKDVQALTFYKNRYTVGRKVIPQLNCKGLCRNQPDIVQCQNVGFDGLDYQWKCNANLDKNVKFSKLEVNCEGYDYPKDPYIIAGSCGLDYTLVSRDHHHSKSDESSSWPFFVFIGFVALFILLTCCKSSDESSRDSQGYNYRGNPTAPPGFRNDFIPQSPPKYSETFTNADQQSSGPGFFSGLSLGALGGYFFGSRNQGSYTSPPVYSDYNYYRPSNSNTYYQDDLNTDSNTYEAEGFGGTKRR